MANVCMRMLAFIMTLAVILAVFAVSTELDFWSFWGKENARSQPRVTSLANAAPLPDGSAPAVLPGGALVDVPVKEREHIGVAAADDIAAIDLAKDGKLGGDSDEDASSGEEPSVDDEDDPADDNSAKREDAVPEAPSAPPSTQPSPTAKPPKENSVSTSAPKQAPKPPESHLPHKSPHEMLSKPRSRAKTFLVVFMGHSGSTAFTTELRTHSDFLVELLEPLDHGEYQSNTDKALMRARELMDRGIAQGKIPGFKLRPYHISNNQDAWRAFVREYDTRVIWQYRENIVKQAVGEYRNRVLNDSSVVEGLSRGEQPCAKGSDQKCSFRIDDFKKLHEIMNDFSTSDELLSEAVRTLRRDHDLTIVKYEDYLYRRERTMREAFNFLGVNYQDTAPQRKKASPDNLCEMVKNYQELCNHFLPCQLWRYYLSDEVNDCRCKPGSWKSFDPSFCQREAWYQQSKL